MVADRLGASWLDAGLVLVSTIAIFAVVIAYVRMLGLRSFSKMSSFDFAMTIAVGTVIGSVAVSPSVTLINGAVALGALFLLQYGIARARRREAAEKLVDNTPRLLMIEDRFIEENLQAARVTRRDVLAKLRSHNVLDLTSVRAVVLETTGEISVLHGQKDLDPELLKGVHQGPSPTTSRTPSARQNKQR